MKNIKEFIHQYWLFLIIITQPILDVIAYFTFDEFLTPFSFAIRSLYLIFIVIYCFFKVKDKKKLILTLLPFIIFSCLHLLNSYRTSGFNLFNDIKYLILVMQMPIITISLSFYVLQNREQEKRIEKGFVLSLIFIFISVILSVITNSYETTYADYGITGWFTSANTQSMILSIVSPLFLFYFSKQKNYMYLFSLIIVFILLYFNGTKACYYTLLSLYLIFIYINLFKKNNMTKTVLTVIFFVASILFYNISFTSSRSVGVDENIKENEVILDEGKYDLNNKDDVIKALKINYLYDQMIKDFGEDRVYEKMKNNINAHNLADNRFIKRIYASIIFEDSDFLTKLVGFNHYEIQQYEMDLENDITAIFYYYGYLGFALYVSFIMFFVILAIKLLKKNPYIIFNDKFILLSFVLMLGAVGAEYSGALLRKSNANIYVALLLVLYFVFIVNELEKGNKNLKNNKVSIFALHLGYGGVEKYISSLCKMLENKYEIEVISTYKVLDKPAFDFSDNIKIKYLLETKPNKAEFKDAISNKKIASIFIEGIKAIKILWLKNYLNVCEIMTIDSKYIITTRDFHNKLVGKYASKDIIKIATEHNYHNNDMKYVNNLIKSVDGFDYFVLVSNSLKNYYEGKVGDTKCIFIPNTLDRMPKKTSSLNNHNVICVGRLEEEKGQIDLIDVISKVKKEINDIKLFLIGDGSKKSELIEKTKNMGLEENIIFTGFLSSKEIEKYMLKSSVYIMTSFTESFGLVLLEAMSYGIPCVAFDSADGANELLKNNIGILVKDRDKSKMAEEIVKLLTDNKTAHKFSENGYNKVKDYLISNVGDEWLKLLNLGVDLNEVKEKK